MGEEPKARPKWRRYLKEEGLGKRLLIGMIILLALAAFVHFKEVHVEMLEPGSYAKHHVVAQIDFQIPDDEDTAIFRQEAARDVNAVYKINFKDVERHRKHFKEFLIHDQRWRTLLPTSTFEALHQTADKVKRFLVTARFVDMRTFQHLQFLNVITPEYFLLPSSFDGEFAVFPNSFWENLQQTLVKNGGVHEATVRYVLHYFQSIQWIMEKDFLLQHTLRQVVGDAFPEQFKKVKAGTKIVGRGEKITQSHVAMVQSMQKNLIRERNIWNPLSLLSSLIFSTVITIVGGCYFYVIHKELIYNVYKLVLYATIIILTLLIAKVTEHILFLNVGRLFEMVRYPLFTPFAAILLCVLICEEVALFSSCFLAVILGLFLDVDHSCFIILNLVAAVVAIFTARLLRKKRKVFVVCGKVWLSCIPIFFMYNFSRNVFWSSSIISDIIISLAFLLLIAIFIVGLLPILETIFHVMTDIILMEYMDPNNELLRRLSVEAPGTYQHCLVVGSLAEAAAQSIGANGLFCRVSTLYHDAGKLCNPHYFTENQMGGFNIHQLLTPTESAQVIISHVAEGETLARKYGLPSNFIDIIREHQGTTLVGYFYCRQLEQMGGDVDAVDEQQFRYPGPKPRSKESAIIMMADTVEAASRSLEDISETSIIELVDRLIGEKLEDGQFDECQLTFEEFGIIKRAIVRTLAVARHLRIKYPQVRLKGNNSSVLGGCTNPH